MKCTVPEIAWHNRDPILSVDFQYNQGTGTLQRLVTGGTDCHVVIWYVKVNDTDDVNLELASDLRRHNKAVNVVRFSPSGEFLASGDDEAAIWIWKKSDKEVNSSPDLFNEDDDKETNQEQWTGVRMLRGHIEDVYDLCWSPDSCSLISGSVDNSAILWDVHKGKKTTILSDHKGFVQGVSWDPLNKYVATLSSDRICRIYNIGSQRAVHKLQKVVVPDTSKISAGTEKATRSIRLYHDDTLKSFCRRLTFSPDGQLLITPSGIFEGEDGIVGNATYIFSRATLTKPALFLPAKEKCTIAVRCCPILFQLRTNKDDLSSDSINVKPWETCPTMFKLPYRIVFAVATQDSVLFYDTQQPLPFGQVANIHYTRLSDLAWSRDGKIVIVSSTDGYCSIITFKADELGTPYKVPEKPSALVTVPPSPPSVPTALTAESASSAEDIVDNKDLDKLAAPDTESVDAPLSVVESATQTPVLSPASTKSVIVTPSSSPAQLKQHKRVAFVTLFAPKTGSKKENKKTADYGGGSFTEQPMEGVNADVTSGTPFASATLPAENRKSGATPDEIEIIDVDDDMPLPVDRNKVNVIATNSNPTDTVVRENCHEDDVDSRGIPLTSSYPSKAKDSIKCVKTEVERSLVVELSNVAVGSRSESASTAEPLCSLDGNETLEEDKLNKVGAKLSSVTDDGCTSETTHPMTDAPAPPVVLASMGSADFHVTVNSKTKKSPVAVTGSSRQPRRVSLITLSAGKRTIEPEFGGK